MLTYEAIHGKCPSVAGLTFEEALAYECKEYRKQRNAVLSSTGSISEAREEQLAKELYLCFEELGEIYGRIVTL